MQICPLLPQASRADAVRPQVDALIALAGNVVLLAGLADVVRPQVDARSARGGRKPPPYPPVHLIGDANLRLGALVV